MNANLPLQPVFTCAHCAKSQRLGARWGAGTTDAANRVFCTFECAWMALLIDEHRANYLAANNSTATAAMNTRYRYRHRSRNFSNSSSRPKSVKTPRQPSSPTTLQKLCTPSDDGHWHAMLGMAALFDEN